MNRKLTLNDGTELTDSYAIQNGSTLWVYVYAEIAFGDLFELLNDPEKTAVITMTNGEIVTEFEGFTDLFCIRKEDGGFISAGLRNE